MYPETPARPRLWRFKTRSRCLPAVAGVQNSVPSRLSSRLPDTAAVLPSHDAANPSFAAPQVSQARAPVRYPDARDACQQRGRSQRTRQSP